MNDVHAFFISNAFFSSQTQYQLYFSWLELQILFRCCIMHTSIIILSSIFSNFSLVLLMKVLLIKKRVFQFTVINLWCMGLWFYYIRKFFTLKFKNERVGSMHVEKQKKCLYVLINGRVLQFGDLFFFFNR